MTPKEMVMKMMGNCMLGNNPMLANVMNMAKSGDSNGIEQFARNICKTKGIDFDTEFEKFKSNFNGR